MHRGVSVPIKNKLAYIHTCFPNDFAWQAVKSLNRALIKHTSFANENIKKSSYLNEAQHRHHHYLMPNMKQEFLKTSWIYKNRTRIFLSSIKISQTIYTPHVLCVQQEHYRSNIMQSNTIPPKPGFYCSYLFNFPRCISLMWAMLLICEHDHIAL